MTCLRPVYDLRFVAMSVGIALIGAYVTICLCDQFRLCSSALTKPKLLDRKGLLLMMSCSLGGVGIWTMHFIGMSSLILYDPDGIEVTIKFNMFRTIVSLIVVLLLSFVGLYFASFDKVFTKTKQQVIEMFVAQSQNLTMMEVKRIKNTRFIMLITTQSLGHLVFGGFWAGSGVCVMHYMGFWAMEFKGRIIWNGGVIAASLLIALIASTLAFWILFRLLSLYPQLEVLRLVSACAMALAVCGMHYTGMAAARFEHKDSVSSLARYGFLDGSMNSYEAFYGTLTVATIFVIVLLVLALADLRAWHYNVLKHLQRADDLITQLQRDHSGFSHSSSAAQANINSYIINRQSDNHTFRSSRTTISARNGQVLVKPAPQMRRQGSSGSSTITPTADTGVHGTSVNSRVSGTGNASADPDLGSGGGGGGVGAGEGDSGAVLTIGGPLGLHTAVIDLESGEDCAVLSRSDSGDRLQRHHHQQQMMSSNSRLNQYKPITRLVSATREGKDEENSIIMSENNVSVFSTHIDGNNG